MEIVAAPLSFFFNKLVYLCLLSHHLEETPTSSQCNVLESQGCQKHDIAVTRYTHMRNDFFDLRKFFSDAIETRNETNILSVQCNLYN